MIELRPLEIDDCQRIYNSLQDASGFLIRNKIISEVEHHDWFARLYKDKSQLYLAITVGGKYSGFVGARDIDYIHKRGSLIIYMVKENRGRGYGNRIVNEFSGYFFKQLNMNKLYLDVLGRNEVAIKCYQKCGFKEEGRFKKHAWLDGNYWDVIRMARFV